jgi:hypothetical protein
MASEERILVSVRLRPVNAREAERGDGSDWECAGPTTLMFHGNIPERAMFPASYTYGENACMHASFCSIASLTFKESTLNHNSHFSPRPLLQTGCSTLSVAHARCTRKGPSRWPYRCSAASTVPIYALQKQHQSYTTSRH